MSKLGQNRSFGDTIRKVRTWGISRRKQRESEPRRQNVGCRENSGSRFRAAVGPFIAKKRPQHAIRFVSGEEASYAGPVQLDPEELERFEGGLRKAGLPK